MWEYEQTGGSVRTTTSGSDVVLQTGQKATSIFPKADAQNDIDSDG